MTLPIPSTVFVDGQRVDEAGLYANVFTPINVLYAQLQTLTQANGLQRGSFSGTMPAAVSQTGTVTFPTAFGGTPNVTLGLMAGTGLLTAKMTTLSSTAFNWNVFYTNNVAGSNTFTVHWMAIG